MYVSYGQGHRGVFLLHTDYKDGTALYHTVQSLYVDGPIKSYCKRGTEKNEENEKEEKKRLFGYSMIHPCYFSTRNLKLIVSHDTVVPRQGALMRSDPSDALRSLYSYLRYLAHCHCMHLYDTAAYGGDAR